MKKFVSIAALALACAAALGAADAAAGKATYEKSCRNCHGADGVANPAIVNMMKVPIPDLKSAEVQKLSEAELRDIVTKGKGKMPAIKAVAGSAVDDVAAYVHSMK